MQSEDEQLNFNEGIVYVEGGIGVVTKQSHAQQAVKQRVVKLNHNSSIGSLGLNDRQSNDSKIQAPKVIDNKSKFNYEPLIS